MPVELESEGACLLCKQGEVNVLRHSSVSRHFSKRVLVIVVVSGVLSVAVSIVVLFGWVLMRRRKRWNEKNEGQMLRFQDNRRLTKPMSLSEIKAATKGFNQNRIIGEGGSAVVYEGELPSCGSVAVKRFRQENRFGSLSQIPFSTEFATMAGALRHKNLIQLEGWCCEKNELWS